MGEKQLVRRRNPDPLGIAKRCPDPGKAVAGEEGVDGLRAVGHRHPGGGGPSRVEGCGKRNGESVAGITPLTAKQ